MNHSSSSTRSHGFTLLEVMTALLLIAMVVSMVLAIARTSLKLSKSIVDSQNAEMEQQAFFDLLGRRFSSMPGNARFDLQVEDTGSQYLSDLTFQNVPMSFTWGGQDRIAKAVQLSTVRRRNGFLDIVLRYYETEILEGSTGVVDSAAIDEKPFAEIVLLENVAYFEWQVLNSSTMEWQYEWTEQRKQPLQVELVMAIGAKGENIRHVFWIPPKQDPELLMRQLSGSLAPASPTAPGSPHTEVHLNLGDPKPGGDQ